MTSRASAIPRDGIAGRVHSTHGECTRPAALSRDIPSPCSAFAPWGARAFFHGRARVETNSRSRPVATTRCACGTWLWSDPRSIGDRWVFGQGSWGRAPARSSPNGDRPINAALEGSPRSFHVKRHNEASVVRRAAPGGTFHVEHAPCSLWSEFDSSAQSGPQETAPRGANCLNPGLHSTSGRAVR